MKNLFWHPGEARGGFSMETPSKNLEYNIIQYLRVFKRRIQLTTFRFYVKKIAQGILSVPQHDVALRWLLLGGVFFRLFLFQRKDVFFTLYPQCLYKHLVHVFHENNIHLFKYLGRYLLKVFFVFLRYDYPRNAAAACGKYLFFKPSYGEDLAPERYLSRHRHVFTDRDFKKRRRNGRCHRDPRGRPVLGDCALGHMYVDIALLVEIPFKPHAFCPAPYIGHCRLRAFLHYLSELSRDCKLTLAGHKGNLCCKKLSSGFRPRKAHRDPNLVFFIHPAKTVLCHPEVSQNPLCRHIYLYLFSLFQNVPDRKSTRLNSSHSQISYAVFCLKKKEQYGVLEWLYERGDVLVEARG